MARLLRGKVILCIFVVAAFEFTCVTGRAGAMLAGSAVADHQHSAALNPALAAAAGRLAGSLAFSRPFGLESLDWLRFDAAGRVGEWSGGLALTTMSLARYRESDLAATVGFEPVRSLAAGLGAHLLTVEDGHGGSDAAWSFDAGVWWRSGTLALAAAGSALNGPRFANGDEIPVRLAVAGSLRPVEGLLLALDLSRVGSDEQAAFGAEFAIVPPLELRAGASLAPLSYGVGIGAHVGPLTLDYSCRFHPRLKETHILGLGAKWR